MQLGRNNLDAKRNSELTDSIELLFCHTTPENLYTSMKDYFINKAGTVYVGVKNYDSNDVVTHSGRIIWMDKEGRGIVLKDDSGEQKPIHFVDFSGAIYSIKTKEGKELYRNDWVLGLEDTPICNNSINAIKNTGTINDVMVPTKLARRSDFDTVSTLLYMSAVARAYKVRNESNSRP